MTTPDQTIIELSRKKIEVKEPQKYLVGVS
jgi:hypothetical protein